MEQNLNTYLPLFHAAYHIPFIWLGPDGKQILEYPKEGPCLHFLDKLVGAFEEGLNPAVLTVKDVGLFGKIKIHDGSCLILGPIYEFLPSLFIVSNFLSYFGFPHEILHKAESFLKDIPPMGFSRFVYFLVYLLYEIDGVKADTTALVASTAHEDESSKKHAEKIIGEQEELYHGTFDLERKLIEFVKEGKVEGLKKFIENDLGSMNTTEGKLAENELRQEQDIFIGMVTRIGKEGAIPGGLGVELTYGLIDNYVQECEKCTSKDQVVSLEYQMLLDFAKWVENQHLPVGTDNDVYNATQFILGNLDKNIQISDVVSSIKKSKSWLTQNFKKELGISVNRYIQKAKLEEAKRLLLYSDDNISEISYSLAFSDQSYFQNLFKKEYKVTPLQFRKQSKKQ
jgi:AraC-like DNA-binding protein